MYTKYVFPPPNKQVKNELAGVFGRTNSVLADTTKNDSLDVQRIYKKIPKCFILVKEAKRTLTLPSNRGPLGEN